MFISDFAFLFSALRGSNIHPDFPAGDKQERPAQGVFHHRARDEGGENQAHVYQGIKGWKETGKDKVGYKTLYRWVILFVGNIPESLYRG